MSPHHQAGWEFRIAVKTNYPSGEEEFFLKSGTPSLPDDEGTIALVSEQGKVIDYFSYTKDLHSELIKDEEGVSLERISFYCAD